MMYTVRFAHLENKPKWKVGSVINRGDHIGVMGNTGKSTAAHTHMDNAKGLIMDPWKLIDVTEGLIPFDLDCVKQLGLHLDAELFSGLAKPIITTPICEADYFLQYKKWHWGYDFVSSNMNYKDLFWNRSKPGEILFNDEFGGYGNLVMIGYDS